jgi:hypothetical protein
MLSDCFLSIVSDCRSDELLIRARRKNDIQRVFPKAKVKRNTSADYLYRAVIPRKDVALALANAVDDINYGNFKNAVEDDALHAAYLKVWMTMAEMQKPPPYSGMAER